MKTRCSAVAALMIVLGVILSWPPADGDGPAPSEVKELVDRARHSIRKFVRDACDDLHAATRLRTHR